MRGTGPDCGPLVLSWVHVDGGNLNSAASTDKLQLQERSWEPLDEPMNPNVLSGREIRWVFRSVQCLPWLIFSYIKKLGRSIVNGWLLVKVHFDFARHCIICILLLTYVRSLEGRYTSHEVLAKPFTFQMGHYTGYRVWCNI